VGGKKEIKGRSPIHLSPTDWKINSTSDPLLGGNFCLTK